MYYNSFFKRFLFYALLPSLVALFSMAIMSHMKERELNEFSNNLSTKLVYSFWQQLSETSFNEMAINAQAITRDNASKQAIVKEDINAISAAVSPTLKRLKAGDAVDGLFVLNEKNEVLFKNEEHDIDIEKIVSEVISKKKQRFMSLINVEEKTLHFAYGFPVYIDGNMESVVVYTKNIEPLLKKFSKASGLQYGLLYNGNIFFNNFEFDVKGYKESLSHISNGEKSYSLVKVALPFGNSKNTMFVIATENTESLRSLDILNKTSIIVPLMAIITITISLFLLIRRISSVLGKGAKCMVQLADKNFDIVVPEYNYDDEVGKIISTISILSTRLKYINDLEEKEKISQQKQLEDAQKLLITQKNLEKSFSELSTYMKGIDQHAMVSVTNEKGIIIEINDKFLQSSGYKKEEIIGKTHNIFKSGSHSDSFYTEMWETISKGKTWSGEVCNRSKSGNIYWVDTSIVPLKNDSGVIEKYISIRIDVTERKKSEQRLVHMGTHDELTGLPNRILLQDRIKQALAHDRRYGSYASVLFIDLDQFKIINDSIGHDIGDLLLVEVASRLLSCVREEDTVARQGGDEFIILLPNIPNPNHAEIVGEMILGAIAKPYYIEGNEIYIRASIGISIFPTDSEDISTLMKNSDIAMYHAKERGRNNYQRFKPEMNTHAKEKHALLSMLHQAIENDEFELHYQPIVDIKTNKISSLEVLIRWNHPEKGYIPPIDFIELAENSGLIVPIGEWVLKTSCSQLKEWISQGYNVPRIAVNLSVKQFYNKGLVKTIDNILKDNGIDGNRLELEITESILMENTDELITTMHSIRGMGIRISVDDFGTGYSSLSYIKNFPIDTLKIDKSFINDIETNAGDYAIVKTIIALAHSLKLDVIAEGVENEGQLNSLKKQNCDNFQGYLYSKPLPAIEIIKNFNKI